MGEADDIALILKDRKFPTGIVNERYQKIDDALGTDFSAIIEAFETILFSLEGDAHTKTRRLQTQLIARSGLNDIDKIRQIALPYLKQFEQPGQFDVIKQVISPIYGDFVFAIGQVSVDISAYRNVVLPMSYEISMRERRQSNEEIMKLRKDMTKSSKDDVRMSLVISGNDPIHATFARCLKAIFEADDPQELLSFDTPPITGVPTVGRELTGSQWEDKYQKSFDGLSYLDLSQFDQTSCPHEQRLRFGAGRHACLGKKISINLWQVMRDYLAELDLTKISVQSFNERDNRLVPTPFEFIVEIEK